MDCVKQNRLPLLRPHEDWCRAKAAHTERKHIP